MAVRMQHTGSGTWFITFTCYGWKPLLALIQSYDAVYKWFDHLYAKEASVVGFVINPRHGVSPPHRAGLRRPRADTKIDFYLYSVGQTALFRMEAANACGTASYDFGFVSQDCSGGGGGCDSYQMSPNPANESVDIIVPNIPAPCDGAYSTTTASETAISEVRIYDGGGTLKLLRKYNKVKKAKISLAGLKTGIYLVEISNGKTVERKQLVVRK